MRSYTQSEGILAIHKAIYCENENNWGRHKSMIRYELIFPIDTKAKNTLLSFIKRQEYIVFIKEYLNSFFY